MDRSEFGKQTRESIPDLNNMIATALRLDQDQRIQLIEQLTESLGEGGRSFLRMQPDATESNGSYTVAQAARICGVSSSTIRKWFDRGELRGYGVPGPACLRVRREALDAYVSKHRLRNRLNSPLPKKRSDGQQSFSAAQVASILGIVPKTVVRKVRRGELQGYFIPGDRIRRIPKENLVKFAKTKGFKLRRKGSAA